MKIGIVSDLHLGHRNVKIETFKNTILKLQNKVDLIVDCGDLTDSNKVDAIQLTELYRIFKDINKPYYIIRGNHDSLDSKTIAKLLELNSNIFVAEKISKVSYNNIDLLLIPYTNNINETFKTLKEKEYFGDFAFSHLNITDNNFSDIKIKSESVQQLFYYSDFWINGHIHTPESYNFGFGRIENIGSISSLTYGDEHIPNYGILDTETKSIERYQITNCIIHKTCNTDFDFDLFQKENCDNYINWRIKLPNDFFMEDRQKIKNKLQNYPNTLNIQFDLKIGKNDNSITSKKYDIKKVNLLEQLFESYEKDNNTILNQDIKRGLSNDKL